MFLFHLIYRWETLPVLLGGLSVAIRPLGRTDPSLPQTHRRQAVQVRPLRTQFLPLRPPGPPPQTPPMKMMLHLFFFFIYIYYYYSLSTTLLYFSSSTVGGRTSNKTTVTRNQNGQNGAICGNDEEKKEKKRISHLSKKKRKPFPPQVFWHELVADVVFNLLGVRKSFDVVAPLTTFVIKEIQHLRVPKLWLWFHSWFVLCTQPRLPRLRPFFLYSGFKGEKNSQSLYDLQSFGQVWSTKFVCSPPTTTMPTKNWMSKHIPIFFFNIFRFLVKKKIENPVWAGKWLNLTKKLSCILEPKFSTQCILLSSCKIKWILTIFILKKKQRKKK